jgi:hypothetical protein
VRVDLKEQEPIIMKPRTILTTALLAFVALTIAVMVAKELSRALARSDSETGAGQTRTPAPEEAAAKVVVYVFHRTVRCPTCLKVEEYTQEVLQTSFADRVADGSIECRVVDYEQPKNEHFREDFDLLGASVVVVRMRDGKTEKWDNLMEAVRMLRDKAIFMTMVDKSVQEMLDAAQ